MKNIMNATLNKNNENQIVDLYGWASKVRDLGGIIFIDLRDRSGIIQLVIGPENEYYEIAKNVRSESVIEVSGKINLRNNINANLPTGEIEVDVTKLTLINTSIDLPFSISNDTTALEDTRLKYRYLDIRRSDISDKLILRHKITIAMRNFLDTKDFIEVETPILCKSTPEGARDYLVPSRVNKDRFYALPQSPQIFKQLLMVGGIERYFQIAKCFRDEDLRKDRQPEFTQLDIEMSFVNEEDVMTLAENLVANVFSKVKNIELKTPFMKLKYDDAINLYGSDKPDLRFDLQLKDLTSMFKNTEIEFMKNKEVNAIVLENFADKYSRKDIDKLVDYVKTYKASGLAFLKMEDELSGSIAKILSDVEKTSIITTLNLKSNDLVLIVSDSYKIVKTALGSLRCKLGKDLNLYSSDDIKTCWIIDFPTFEYSEEENRYMASHHPFTMPKDDDVDKLSIDKDNCYSKAYDMVINGYEVGGGSIRIHDSNIQEKMFEALELTEQDIEEKFGFFVEALKYGTPPHGGLAFGLDRITMILANTENIRDVIAFPKTASASCLMSECPGTVSEKQLDELHISLNN